MAERRAQRKLAAILAADVVGYSRLMGVDEEGTLDALTGHRRELIEPAIAEHRGRLVKATGDGLIVEFASVVDAVRCAVAVQQGMRARNADVPADRRIELRIGANLGDVIVQDDDVFGDGVNIAARLEGIAEPGGVIVSAKVHEEVRTRLDLAFDDLGPQQVKNIAEPVRAFRVRAAGDAPLGNRPKPDAALPLPDKPSIAVLPFDNMSGDPEQQYFSDGISEDIITDLSKISGLFVIARNSSFVYRGETVAVAEASRELGVRYILEGSVRKAGNRVRVTAQLIDGRSEGHLWAERFDRDLTDIFAVQDEIVREIVAALAARLTADERSRLAPSATDNMEAYDLFLRGRELSLRQTRETNEQSKPLLERAIALSPDFASAYAILAIPLLREYINGWVAEPEKSLMRSLQLTEQAVALDPQNPIAHGLLGRVLMWMKRLDAAAQAVERAIELEPNSSDSYAALGQIYTYSGRPADGVEQMTTAMRLDPHFRDIYLHFLGHAHFMAGQYEHAAVALRRRLVRRPDTDISRVLLAACYGHLGRFEEARDEWAEAFRVNPDYSLEHRRHILPFRNPADFDRIPDGLRKAGLAV